MSAERRWVPVPSSMLEDEQAMTALVERNFDTSKPVTLHLASDFPDLGPDYPQDMNVLLGYAKDDHSIYFVRNAKSVHVVED